MTSDANFEQVFCHRLLQIPTVSHSITILFSLLVEEMNLKGLDHGIDINSPYFVAWFIGVPAVFIGLVLLFRGLDLWNFKTRRGSRASDIMAFEIVAGLCVLYLAVAGVIGSFGLFGFPNEYARLRDLDKFYARSTFVEDHLVYPMISYQGWNLLISFFNNDLNDPAMIMHHLITGSLGYFGLYPYLHFNGLFYFGIAELTNVPLTIVDIFKYFPDLAKRFSWLNELCRYSFAISFFILRIIVWPYVSYEFWVGSVNLLQSGKAHSTFVVAFFLLANLFLTGLQFFWCSKIFGFLFKKPKGSAEKSK